MTWAKFDDGYPDNPKIVPLSDAAFRMHVSSVCYSSRHLLDGRIPQAVAHRYVTRRGRHSALELIRAGLFEEADHDYIVHDFHDYNPTSKEVLSKREARAEAGRKGGASKPPSKTEANEQAKGKQNGTPYPVPEPVTPGDSSKSLNRGDIAARLAAACDGLASATCFDVVCDFADHLDLRVIDECVGYLGALPVAKRPRSKAYIVKTLRQWAEQRGVEVPAEVGA